MGTQSLQPLTTKKHHARILQLGSWRRCVCVCVCREVREGQRSSPRPSVRVASSQHARDRAAGWPLTEFRIKADSDEAFERQRIRLLRIAGLDSSVRPARVPGGVSKSGRANTTEWRIGGAITCGQLVCVEAKGKEQMVTFWGGASCGRTLRYARRGRKPDGRDGGARHTEARGRRNRCRQTPARDEVADLVTVRTATQWAGALAAPAAHRSRPAVHLRFYDGHPHRRGGAHQSTERPRRCLEQRRLADAGVCAWCVPSRPALIPPKFVVPPHLMARNATWRAASDDVAPQWSQPGKHHSTSRQTRRPCGKLSEPRADFGRIRPKFGRFPAEFRQYQTKAGGFRPKLTESGPSDDNSTRFGQTSTECGAISGDVRIGTRPTPPGHNTMCCIP